MKSTRVQNRHTQLIALLFILPALIPLLVFWIIPVVHSLLLSFTDWDMISPDFDVVMFGNYRSLFQDPKFATVLKNTLVFAVGTTVPTIAIGLLLALAMNGIGKGLGLYRTTIFAPYITPMVAVSIVWSWIFEPTAGVLNFILSLFGMPGLEWNKSMDTAMLSVIIVTVWKQIGWTMIFYMEALKKVPQHLIEAAKVDGASAFTRFIKVTLPAISPTTFFLVIMSTINSLQAYDQIKVLTNGGPAGATETILTLYYREAFQAFNTGKAAAVAVVLVIITVVVSILESCTMKRFTHYD